MHERYSVSTHQTRYTHHNNKEVDIAQVKTPETLRVIGFIDIRDFHYRAHRVFTGNEAEGSVVFGDAAAEPSEETINNTWTLPRVNPQLLMQAVCQSNNWQAVQTRVYCDIPSFKRTWFWHRMWTTRVQDAQRDGCVVWTPQQSTVRSVAENGKRLLDVHARIGMDVISAFLTDQCDAALIFSEASRNCVIVDKARELGRNRYVKMISAFPSNELNYHGVDRTDWLPLSANTLLDCFDGNIVVPR